MKHWLLTLFVVFQFIGCTTAQYTYSSKDKKAIELLKKGQEAARSSYAEATTYALKAIVKDPNFWEAHLFAGEMFEYQKKNKEAIYHYREALRINPTHSPSGGTYFYLGALEYATNDFENAKKDLNKYITFKNADPKQIQAAREILEACDKAIEALKNPEKFEPVNLGPGVNTADPEYFPTITVDGKTLLFTRRIHDDKVPGPMKEQEDFYVSNLTQYNAWGTAVAMPENINTVRNEGAPTIAADGRSLIFVACAMGDVQDYGPGREGAGSCDMFVTKRMGNNWTNPTNLAGKINTLSWESQPSLSADGRTIYFIRRVSGRGMEADADVFMSKLQDDGSWGVATRLPNTINTPYPEESVLIHPDGKTLYFASRGHKGFGGLDLYVSRMDAAGNWGPAENLGYPINTAADENSLLVSADGEIAFFASDRPGGYGKLDIYYFIMPERIRPTKTLYFDGLVYDVTTPNKKPIPGKFTLIDIKTGKEIVHSEADPLTGAFTVSLPINCEYVLNVSYPGYNFFSQNFNMTVPDNQEVVHMDVPMVPISSPGIPVTLKNVFFDLSKATLRPESFIELNKLRDFLKSNPTLRIEIAGHTDTRGDAVENQKLSEARAKSVMDYLIAQGIDAKRLTSNGYGETKPIITDEAIAKMTTDKEKEKAHQENRRTEYVILK
jgi:outer membrane protein OmpA-like peptidoglycan-associated protein